MKTRLLGALTAEQAAAVHRACVEDTVRHASGVTRCAPALCVAGTLRQARRLAASLGLDARWRVCAQRGRDLGMRLRNASEAFFRRGYRKVIVVGTDTPWMGRRRILRAMALLDHADAVLGPTADGGYYLLGTRRSVPQMFRNIPWSTPQVFAATHGAIRKAGANDRLLRRDFDLDRPEDLRRAAKLLRRNPQRAPALARLLNNWSAIAVSRSSRRRGPARRSKTRRPGRV